ncbi:ribosome maturation factor RimM [Luteibacter aegosomatis]|uniref:ribosome maturation factor RimM n=1 Tax=Luteibacter TaxID=242605 RepID=UPI001FFB6269|nr:ribosome maturation factor RimM [Luteibacter aegosomatis]UPG87174.1 ribosome maturation factor RimM [Luteibacter aegosomatis]
MSTESGKRVRVGRIVGLHGVQGQVKLESWTEPRIQIFRYQPWLLTAPGVNREMSGIRGNAQGKGIVASLPGITDRDQAAALVGCEITVSRDVLPPPAPGEFYWVDLENLEVVTTENVHLGRVSHLFSTGANDVMVVKDGERERLVPFVQGPYVHSVDFDSGRIVVDWDPEF